MTERFRALEEMSGPSAPLLSSMSEYCRAANAEFSETTASCLSKPQWTRSFVSPPYSTSQAPDAPACLAEAMNRCNGFGPPLEVAACRHAASYSLRPRTLVTEETLRTMANFPQAFSAGMKFGQRCPAGPGDAMPPL